MTEERFGASVNRLSQLIEQLVIDRAVERGATNEDQGFVLVSTDPNDYIIEASVGMHELLGYNGQKHELLSKRISEINDPDFDDDMQWHYSHLWETSSGVARNPTELVFYKNFLAKDGSKVPVGIIAATTRLQFGEYSTLSNHRRSPVTEGSKYQFKNEKPFGLAFAWACRVNKLPLRDPPVQPYEFKRLAELGKNVLPFQPPY